MSTCWVVTEGLTGLQNQAIGLAEALGVPYTAQKVEAPQGVWRFIRSCSYQLAPPWPDLLIACGRRSVPVSVAVRQASCGRTFTVFIQDPFVSSQNFDVVIAPAHDAVRGENVFLTQGAVHRVTGDKLADAARHFGPLLASLHKPVVTVLIGGKNKHQDFNQKSADDFSQKLGRAVKSSGGSLAVSFSRRTGERNERLIREKLSGFPCYIWDGRRENPYFGLLALADALVVTSDSISMLSEACAAGKPVYIYELPNAGRRHQRFCDSLIESGKARRFSGLVDMWNNPPLDETRKAANFVMERYMRRAKAYADLSAANPT